jgi:hypothetical protein
MCVVDGCLDLAGGRRLQSAMVGRQETKPSSEAAERFWCSPCFAAERLLGRCFAVFFAFGSRFELVIVSFRYEFAFGFPQLPWTTLWISMGMDSAAARFSEVFVSLIRFCSSLMTTRYVIDYLGTFLKSQAFGQHLDENRFITKP